MMHPETMELLGKMLIMLKRYGEEDTLVYIRERILTGRYPKDVYKRQNVFSNVIGQISIGDTGYAMVVDAKGNIIAHPDSELIPQMMNYISLASQDGSYQTMADCVSSAIAGESGFGEVTLDGVSKYVSYAPISNAKGWSCIMIATPSEHTPVSYTHLDVYKRQQM